MLHSHSQIVVGIGIIFVSGKLYILIWRICQCKLRTMENFFKFGIFNPTTCKICNNATKNEDHKYVVSCGLWKPIKLGVGYYQVQSFYGRSTKTCRSPWSNKYVFFFFFFVGDVEFTES